MTLDIVLVFGCVWRGREGGKVGRERGGGGDRDRDNIMIAFSSGFLVALGFCRNAPRRPANHTRCARKHKAGERKERHKGTYEYDKQKIGRAKNLRVKRLTIQSAGSKIPFSHWLQIPLFM
jgi:hypothetical protein